MGERGQKRALLWLSWLGCLGMLGCACPLYTVHPVSVDLAETCHCVASCSRSRVHIFFVQGLDPLDCANLEGVKNYVHDLGFSQAWFGHPHHVRTFAREVTRIRQADPEARVVVVGFSHGIDPSRKLAAALAEREQAVDLLVCLDSTLLGPASTSRPDNVRRMITVVARDDQHKRSADGETELYDAQTSSLSTPTHPGTLDLLARELATLAGSLPAIKEMASSPFPQAEERTPRPTNLESSPLPEEWRFLRLGTLQQKSGKS